MSDHAEGQPRWGNLARERKALAILSTLQKALGQEILDGVWLDVGCGSGGIATELARHVKQVVGVDPEPWAEWNSMQERNKNLSFKMDKFDETHLLLEEETTDIVVCNQVYEHVSNPQQLIRNIARILKPGGHCYFAGPNLLWPIEPHVHWPFVHWLPRATAQRVMRALGSTQHEALDAYSTTYCKLMSWFNDAGLRPHDAMTTRLVVELEKRNFARVASLIDLTPKILFRPFLPISPGFVFILLKH